MVFVKATKDRINQHPISQKVNVWKLSQGQYFPIACDFRFDLQVCLKALAFD